MKVSIIFMRSFTVLSKYSAKQEKQKKVQISLPSSFLLRASSFFSNSLWHCLQWVIGFPFPVGIEMGDAYK